MKRHRRRVTDINTVCPICGGSVEGYHFGVLVCRPCASFFRRTVAAKHVYTCPLKSECEIRHDQRTMCKGCRFRLCVDAGMNPKAVQYNRDPIGPKKREDGAPMSSSVSTPSTSVSSSVSSTSAKKLSDTSRLLSYSVPSTSSTTSSSNDDGAPLLEKLQNSFRTFLKSECSLYALLFPEKPVASSEDFTNTRHTDFIKMERGCLTYTKAMLSEWCPTFESFPEPMKMTIFRNFFSNFSPFLKGFRTSITYAANDPRIVMSYGQYVSNATEADLFHHYQDDADPEMSMRVGREVVGLTKRLGNKMLSIQCREVEFLALSVIMFCNEISMMHPHPEVERLHDQVMSELHENIINTYPALAVGSRMGTLILMINDADTLRKDVAEFVAMCRMFGPHNIELWDD